MLWLLLFYHIEYKLGPFIWGWEMNENKLEIIAMVWRWFPSVQLSSRLKSLVRTGWVCMENWGLNVWFHLAQQYADWTWHDSQLNTFSIWAPTSEFNCFIRTLSEHVGIFTDAFLKNIFFIFSAAFKVLTGTVFHPPAANTALQRWSKQKRQTPKTLHFCVRVNRNAVLSKKKIFTPEEFFQNLLFQRQNKTKQKPKRWRAKTT